MHPKSRTVISAAAAAIVRALDERGLDGFAIAERSGISREVLADPRSRIREEVLDELFRLVLESAGESFPLAVADQMRTGSYEGLFFAMLSSRSLRDAIRRYMRFQRVIADIVRLDFVEEQECSLITITPHCRERVGAVDCASAAVAGMCRDVTGNQSLSPVAVELCRSEPADPAPFCEVFRAPITFDSSRNALSYRNESLSAALPTAHAELARQNDRVVIEYLEKSGMSDLTNQVRRAVIELLPDGTPGQTDIAKALAMSPRSLQRHLEESGTSFREVLTEARRTLATGWLGEGRMNVTEVAFLLGFSDSSSFSRAFRRWTGKTPSQFSTGC